MNQSKQMSKEKIGFMANKKNNQLVTRIASYGVLLTMTFLIIVPVLWMVSTSLKSEDAIWDTPIEVIPSEPTLFNFKDRKSTRLNSSHIPLSRMPSSA